MSDSCEEVNGGSGSKNDVRFLEQLRNRQCFTGLICQKQKTAIFSSPEFSFPHFKTALDSAGTGIMVQTFPN